ncbi:MAG TPA: pentapeptide repeat-containing protein [Gaiellaceae bacterium]|nr:pentapeptide repeat-containing protein [Gaiellaceae bacterium]
MSVDPPAAPKRPELPDELEETTLGDAPLTGLRLERVSLRGLAFEERAAADLRIEESLLDKVALDGCEAAGLTLTDVRVTGGSWANLRAVRGSLTRVEARELRATGADFAETELRDVVFEGCRLDLASFRFAKLARIAFRDCRLEESDFHGATLSSVRFEQCALVGANVDGASFSQSELRDCELTGLTGAGSLGGVRMPWGDVIQIAGLLAAATGIEVVD